jgi:hypothetical protein
MPGAPARLSAVIRSHQPPLRRLGTAAVVAICALSCAALAAGCGGAASSGKTATVSRTQRPSKRAAATGGAGAAGKQPAATSKDARKRALVRRVDVSSDRIIAEGKVHIAAGAPSDAEVKREIEQASKHGIKLPAGESVAAFEAAEAQSEGPAAGAETPLTPWNPRIKPIASWIVPVLAWAYEHGWHGTVTSGFRTLYEQVQLNAAGAFSAPAGYSNHETTAYPGGAVDVTAPGQLLVVLRGYPGPRKLVGGVLGPVDPEHFSATGD